MTPTLTKKQYDKYASDPAAFRADLFVDVDGSVKRLGHVMDPWQREDFAAIDPGLMRCNGRAENPEAKMRAYLERGRGHSKTTDIAITCIWALAFATRPIKGYAFAADKDQAALLKNAMETIIRLNPWLAKLLEVQKNAVINIAKSHPAAGAALEISASDVGSSYGILPDFIVVDELTHWSGDGSLWTSIFSSAAKRSNCLLFVIANAGVVDHWTWAVREAARTDELWYFSRLDGPKASWITPQRLEEQRRLLPPIAYSRLWLNLPSSGGGDALTEADINAAFIDGLAPMTGQEKGWAFVAGVDLGLVRDAAAVVVLAVEPGKAGRIRLAHHKLWRPVPGRKINLLDVERHLVELHKRFNLRTIGYDPWQMEHLAQSLRADLNHFDIRELPPQAGNLRQIATLTIEFFNDRRFYLYDCEPLRRDLKKLRVEEKSYGVRLTSPRDGEGHGDTFSAFANGLLVANELAGEYRPSALEGIGAWAGDTVDHTTAFDARQRAYEDEQKFYNHNDDPSGFKEAVMMGRLEWAPSFNPFGAG